MEIGVAVVLVCGGGGGVGGESGWVGVWSGRKRGYYWYLEFVISLRLILLRCHGFRLNFDSFMDVLLNIRLMRP